MAQHKKAANKSFLYKKEFFQQPFVASRFRLETSIDEKSFRKFIIPFKTTTLCINIIESLLENFTI